MMSVLRGLMTMKAISAGMLNPAIINLNIIPQLQLTYNNYMKKKKNIPNSLKLCETTRILFYYIYIQGYHIKRKQELKMNE